jgi:potassium efflux system protein
VAAALALWCAWVDVLPALGILNSVMLWGTNISVTMLIAAGLTLATTVIAAKNIPGLLEMAVLQHLPLEAGSRYALATVSRYLITIVGIIGCCSELGLGWSKVQWLVAAMSLGLGFGLQEIFANFISGLIILFERPVRVGDVVTIGETSGVVSRIRMRATTITDWDRKELIIPNKEFITGRVLNWTLSNAVNRVTINVGVAYGTDAERTKAILLRIAQEHPLVLRDPPPHAMLESFGDSALNFALRCYLPNLDNRGTVIHELHVAVDREFRAAGIEIAFPQQDVHVRTLDLSLDTLLATRQGASLPTIAQTPPDKKAA